MSKKINFSTAAVAALSLTAFVPLSSPAFASGNFTVSNCNSAGAGSFPQALIDAENASGGTVTFQSNLSCSELIVPDTYAIANDLTIVGPTNGDVVVHSTNTYDWDGLFHSTTGGDLSISDLSFDLYAASLIQITSGEAGASTTTLTNVKVDAGGLDELILLEDLTLGNHPMNLTLTNVEITDSHVDGNSVVAVDGNLDITDSKFVGNSYSEGVMVGALGTLSVTDTIFTDNDNNYIGRNNNAPLLYSDTELMINGVSVSGSDNIYSVYYSEGSANMSEFSVESSTVDIVGFSQNAVIRRSSFTNNTSVFSMVGSDNLRLENTTFSSNNFGQGEFMISGGIGLYLSHNTFVDNVEANSETDNLFGTMSEAVLTGNIFASSTGRSFRCTTGSIYDNAGNLFTDSPEDCAMDALPVASAGNSGTVTWNELKLGSLSKLKNGTYAHTPQAGSIAIDFYNESQVGDTDFLSPNDQGASQVRPTNTNFDSGAVEFTTLAKTKKQVFFAPNSAALKPTVKQALRKFVNQLPTTSADTKISVQGFVQPDGRSWNNTTLSRARAKAVVKFLKAIGVKGVFKITVRGEAKLTSYKARKVVIKFKNL